MRRALKLLATVTTLTLAGFSTAAQAQYIEGNHQVRAGFFIEPGRTSFDVIEYAGSTTANGGSKSFGFGASGGLEWIRAGSYTWGLELDVATANGSKTIAAFTPAVKVSSDYSATFRGRLGFYARPDLIVYGTLGAGALGTELTNVVTNSKASATNFGTVYGGGIEYHRGATILFLEYLHGNYGTKTVNVSGTNYAFDADTNTIRLGVKFKVGHDWKDDHRHPDHYQPMK